MLLSFRCSNYRSIRDEQELSMMAGPTKNHENHVIKIQDGHGDTIPVLKGALIFGANGSGKSNVFKAMRFSSQLIIKNKPDFESTGYYMMDPSYSKKPSMFEYEFELNGHVYRYGFEIMLSTKSVISEWLNEVFVDGEDISIFIRDENGKISFNNEDYKLDVSCTSLFIQKGKDESFVKEGSNQKIIGDICYWFYSSVATLRPEARMLYDYDLDDERNIVKMGQLLSFFDTGITGMNFYPHSEGEEDLTEVNNSRISRDSKIFRGKNAIYKKVGPYNQEMVLRCEHGVSKIPVRSDQESDGTQRLWNLSPVLLRDDREFVYIIDEMDRYLHPMAVYAFVEWFMKKNYKINKQLIIITHNTHLLDQDLIRRDEIWFTQKDHEGSTELYSLDDYNVRFDKKIEKAYLEGNFKGMPNIKLPDDLDDY